MPATREIVISATIWAALIGIVGLYSSELVWSLENFGGALQGRFAPPPEKMYLDAAIKQMDSGDEGTKALLLKAEAIDPNLSSKYYLAVLSLGDDDVLEAERLLLELLQIDDTHLDSYLLLIELYREAGRQQPARKIAARGVHVFRERSALHVPVPSTTHVAESRKSANVHKRYERAVELLQGKLKGLRT